MHSLQDLTLACGNAQFHDFYLHKLAALSKLTRLNLKSTDIFFEELQDLSCLEALKTLELVSCKNVDDGDLKTLAKHALSLKYIKLWCCPSVNFSLDDELEDVEVSFDPKDERYVYLYQMNRACASAAALNLS